jgi:hypothetical protein
MSKPLIPGNAISFVRLLRQHSAKHAELADKRVDGAEELKQTDLRNTNLLLSNLNTQLMFVYSLLDITMTSLNDLENLIVEKEATKEEMDRFKTELHERIKDTLKPLRDAFGIEEGRLKRAEDLYD